MVHSAQAPFDSAIFDSATDLSGFEAELSHDVKHLTAIRRAVSALLENASLLTSHRKRFADLLAELRDQLAVHFALKESQGYLQSVVENAPRLSDAVEKLRHEHSQLFEAICSIADESQELSYRPIPSGQLEELIARLSSFAKALETHEETERQLVFEACDRDIGGEG